MQKLVWVWPSVFLKQNVVRCSAVVKIKHVLKCFAKLGGDDLYW